MRLEIASSKAIKYACMNFHYAKAVPVNTFGYSVFSEKNEWCGVVLFSLGANKNLSKFFNLNQGEVVELVRMALNGKHNTTSKVLALSIKLLKKQLPLAKIIVSYADGEQGHIGVIYQATNWIYTGESQQKTMLVNGEKTHKKSIYSKYGHNSLEKLKTQGINAKWVMTAPKMRYIYPIDKTLVPLCKSLSKPYPKKNANEVNVDKCPNSIGEIGGSNPTHSLK